MTEPFDCGCLGCSFQPCICDQLALKVADEFVDIIWDEIVDELPTKET